MSQRTDKELLVNRTSDLFEQNKRKAKMKINTSRKAGFTLVEIMIVVAIIGLLAAIAIPNFVKARASSQKNACIANLKQIEGAKATWYLETKAPAATPCALTDIVGTDKYIAQTPTCPGGGTPYVPGTLTVQPVCSLAAEGHTLVVP